MVVCDRIYSPGLTTRLNSWMEAGLRLPL